MRWFCVIAVVHLANASTSVDPQVTTPSTCTWPSCMPHCIPCKAREVGTCYFAGIFGDLGNCDPQKGPTDCMLGKCLCKDGYCAHGDMCKPQVCFAGAEPPRFRPGRWLAFFSGMSDLERFPEYDELQRDYIHLIKRIAPVPVLFLLLGIVVSITTCACLFCGGSGYHYSMDFADMNHDDVKGFVSGKTGHTVVGDEEFAKRAWKQRPSCLPMFCVALLIILLCLFGGITRIVNSAWTEYIILSSLDRAQDNAIEIANASMTINDTVTHLHDSLLEIPMTCKTDSKAAKQVLYTFVHKALGAIEQYVEQVYFIVGTIQPIPEQIGKFQDLTHRLKPWFTKLPLAPLWLVALICLGIVIEATCTTCCRSSSMAKCVDLGLKLSALLFGLIVMVVAVLVFVETSILIVLSKFCEDVDHNVLAYVNATTTNISYIIPEIANYYIRGGSANPIDEYDTLAMKYINQIQDYYNQASIGVAALGMACPAFFALDVNQIAKDARHILERARGLLKGENIYPYYRKVIRTGICGVVISGVGWMWLLQVLVGLLLFPLCAIFTHKFLVDWAAWQKVKEARRAKKMSGQYVQSDDSSDSDGASIVSETTSVSERSPMMGKEFLPAGP
ncbi:grpE [Symbiodinium natans]|uniref:GrpE protein n=1 Tax=Symbiodinium natans TaxID=878477 RepID=A0A812S9E6_9DINO|nr:grpE [Symbiodinium natans]